MVVRNLKKYKIQFLVTWMLLMMVSGLVLFTEFSLTDEVASPVETREGLLDRYQNWGEAHQLHYLERYQSVRDVNRRLVAHLLQPRSENMEIMEATAGHGRNDERLLLYLKLTGSQRQDNQAPPIAYLCFAEAHPNPPEKRSRQSVVEQTNRVKNIDLHQIQGLRGPPQVVLT